MAERTSQLGVTDRHGNTTYTTVTTTVKKGTSDTPRGRGRGGALGERHLGFSSGPRNKRTRRGHLMDPWFLKIRDRTKD